MAFDKYGGISEQNYCNCHPIEQEVLGYWVNIYTFSPDNYDYLNAWQAKWFATAGGQEVRRTAFETHYGFTFGQEVNPIDGKLVDVIYIGNDPYFHHLAEWFQEGSFDCSDLMFPAWP